MVSGIPRTLARSPPRPRSSREGQLLDFSARPYWHAPFWQVDGATQTVPQLPQFALLVVVSTQLPAQSVYGAAQVHWLSTQLRLPPQVAPQKPQFPLLAVRSTQLFPHCAWFDRH